MKRYTKKLSYKQQRALLLAGRSVDLQHLEQSFEGMMARQCIITVFARLSNAVLKQKQTYTLSLNPGECAAFVYVMDRLRYEHTWTKVLVGEMIMDIRQRYAGVELQLESLEQYEMQEIETTSYEE